MTLQDAVDKQFYEEPTKRIVRKPNAVGWCDLWFAFSRRTRKLMVHSYAYKHNVGMVPVVQTAPFQMSAHTDWILI